MRHCEWEQVKRIESPYLLFLFNKLLFFDSSARIWQHTTTTMGRYPHIFLAILEDGEGRWEGSLGWENERRGRNGEGRWDLWREWNALLLSGTVALPFPSLATISIISIEIFTTYGHPLYFFLPLLST
jgi:hypothetical protein